jgi:diphosphomevalonate decarboxylase
MSALALCLCTIEDQLFGTLSNDEQFTQKASYIARLGSGSACRSIYPTMALWGETADFAGSSDEFAVPLSNVHPVFTNFLDDVLIVSKAEKSVSSRAGHNLMNNNVFAPARYEQAKHRITTLLNVIAAGDVETFGKIAEDEALALHGLMMTSDPSYMLMQPNSIAIIQKIRQFRQESKLPLYFSLDAGPNVHLLYPEEVAYQIKPFVDQELAPFCENNFYLQDWVGEGPEEL